MKLYRLKLELIFRKLNFEDNLNICLRRVKIFLENDRIILSQIDLEIHEIYEL